MAKVLILIKLVFKQEFGSHRNIGWEKSNTERACTESDADNSLQSGCETQMEPCTEESSLSFGLPLTWEELLTRGTESGFLPCHTKSHSSIGAVCTGKIWNPLGLVPGEQKRNFKYLCDLEQGNKPPWQVWLPSDLKRGLLFLVGRLRSRTQC